MCAGGCRTGKKKVTRGALNAVKAKLANELPNLVGLVLALAGVPCAFFSDTYLRRDDDVRMEIPAILVEIFSLPSVLTAAFELETLLVSLLPVIFCVCGGFQGSRGDNLHLWRGFENHTKDLSWGHFTGTIQGYSECLEL
jgi:hypothetical protein